MLDHILYDTVLIVKRLFYDHDAENCIILLYFLFLFILKNLKIIKPNSVFLKTHDATIQ